MSSATQGQQTIGLRRSLLYVPATKPRALEKALELPADVIIVDLEDSVGPAAKDQARDAAVAALRRGFPGKTTALRINGLDTPWGQADLKAVVHAQPDVVVLPKVSTPEPIQAVARGIGTDTRLWAMIESCMALIRMPDIAGAAKTSGLAGLLVGTNDLAAEMGCHAGVDRHALVPALSQVVITARAWGLTPLDGPFNDFEDHGGMEIQCRHAAELGFDGKSLIHPAQIEAANRAFSPSAERIAWARAVIAAFQADPKAGVLNVDGRMVERMHLREAQAIARFALSSAP
ncbi:MAG TPA: CoA ester lyase [Caulobacteraceae bacterium]|jgi:citrate lyase subunit beta/citryl-CoA lyase